MSKDLWETNMGHQRGNWDIGSTNYQEGRNLWLLKL